MVSCAECGFLQEPRFSGSIPAEWLAAYRATRDGPLARNDLSCYRQISGFKSMDIGRSWDCTWFLPWVPGRSPQEA